MKRGVLGLVGAGAVGPAVALVLSRRGWTLGRIASRRRESAEEAVVFLSGGSVGESNADAAEGADLLLLAVPDGEIAGVARELAESGRVARGTLVLHLSGALSSSVLSPLRDRGACVGSMHPLQSFADRASAAERIADAHVFFEGDDPERISEIARDLSPHITRLDAKGKALYHAGAAAACNLATAMVDLGVRLMEAAGIGRDEALDALLPLVAGTVANLGEVGLPRALTGPVARGDVETVRRHLEEMKRAAPDLVAAYAAASLHAIRVAREKGTLTAEREGELRALLEQAVEAPTRPPPPS